MTLQVTGKINMQNAECEKCGEIILSWVYSDIITCGTCGAIYNVSASTMEDQYIQYEFEFVEFQCMQKSIAESCNNYCPAPGMYCKEHTSDKAFKDANNSIRYSEERLATAKEKLELMEESKKTWLIQEMSGIEDDKDNTI